MAPARISGGCRDTLLGQANDELCLARLRIHLDLPAKALSHNPLHNFESQPRAFTDWLGGKEGVEDLRLQLLRNTAAVIDDPNHQIARLAPGAHFDLPAL